VRKSKRGVVEFSGCEQGLIAYLNCEADGAAKKGRETMDFQTAIETLQATVDAHEDRARFNGLADFVAICRLTVAASEAIAEGRRPAAPVLAILRRRCERGLGVVDLPRSPVWYAANNAAMDAPVVVARTARKAWVSIVKAAN